MDVPSPVLFLLSIVTLAVGGVGIWTPWWQTYPELEVHSGLFMVCAGTECIFIFSIPGMNANLFIVAGCAALASIFLLLTTVCIAIATLQNTHDVRALLKGSFVCSCLAFSLLFGAVGVLFGILTADAFGGLSFSAYLTFVALVLSMVQNILIRSRYSRMSTEVAVV